MRLPITLVIALVAAGCGSSSTMPTPVYHAALTATNPIVGACVDVRCTFSSVVTNSGPDCASQVAMAISVTAAPLFPLFGVGASAGGVVLRPGQSVTVTGFDWPKGGIIVTSPAGSGLPIVCP